MRLRVEYFDHGESFKPHLPCAGTVVTQLTDESGNAGWYLVELDEPIEYQARVDLPFQFELWHVNRLLLRSRWKGTPIGGEEPPSVFILLVKEEQQPEDGFAIDDYLHAAWGMAYTE